MTRLLLSISVALSLVVGAVVASAAPMKWNGTLTLELATLEPIGIDGSGIATVNGSTGYGHLNQVFLDGGFNGGQTVPITDPEVTGASGIISIRVTVTKFGPGTLGEISGGPPISPNILPVGGVAKICLYDPNCLPGGFIALPLTVHTSLSGTDGLGVGGLISAGGFGGIRISIVANPWTIGTVTALDETDNGAIVVESASGFIHGPASLTSSTAKPSGVVQFVTPLQVTTNLTGGSNQSMALFGRTTLHFIPEPGILLLLGSGVAGLVLLGRSRMRK
jgi:hypothetical protein